MKTPEERLSALEEMAASQASQLNDLTAQVDQYATSLAGLTDGMTDQSAKIDDLISALQASNASDGASAAEPVAAPAASEPAPEASGLTADVIVAAVKDATSGDLSELRNEIAALKEARDAAAEAAATLVADDEGSIEASAKIGDESASPEGPKTYGDFFAADSEVNPHGWDIDSVPKTQAGIRALRNMELRYGPEASFNPADFGHNVKLGGGEFNLVRSRSFTVGINQ